MAGSSVSPRSAKYKDLSGLRFGRLTALEDVGRSRHGKVLWRCGCECGGEKTIVAGDLRSGKTLSCGCYMREVLSARKTHGMTGSPEFQTWVSMIARCRYETATGYDRYGGRGIKVCDRWTQSFEAFYADVGPRPSSEHSLDRYPDIDGDYEPGNVRWASVIDQARNKRTTFAVTVGGETKSLAEWCEIRRLNYRSVHDRLKKLGWSPEEALEFKARSATAA